MGLIVFDGENHALCALPHAGRQAQVPVTLRQCDTSCPSSITAADNVVAAELIERAWAHCIVFFLIVPVWQCRTAAVPLSAEHSRVLRSAQCRLSAVND